MRAIYQGRIYIVDDEPAGDGRLWWALSGRRSLVPLAVEEKVLKALKAGAAEARL